MPEILADYMSNGERIISRALIKLEKEHGSLENLMEMVQAKKCQGPTFVDDYLVWVTLKRNEGVSLEDSIEYDHPWILDTLTEKRLDMLRHITLSEPGSIKSLATDLGRDYKNVYDDVLVLNNSGLIEMVQEGRRKRPVALVKQIQISIF